jgi:hypothetical protein
MTNARRPLSMFRTLLAASLLFALLDPALAAEVRLGPETTLTPIATLGQTDVQLARSGDHEIAVWRDQPGRILAFVDGASISVNGVAVSIMPSVAGGYIELPAVAAANGNFLIVWFDGGRVVGERIALDGRVLDSAPIVLWTGSLRVAQPRRPTITSDGSTFLVSGDTGSGSSYDVFAVRVAGDGTIRDLSTFPFGPGHSQATFIGADQPQVAWTGSGFFLGYLLVRDNPCSPDCHIANEIGGLLLDATGESPPPTPSVLFDSVDSLLDYVPLTMAFGGGRVTFVWALGPSLGVAQTTASGTPLAPPRIVRYLPDFCDFTPAVQWDGAEFVVAWIGCAGSTVRAIRLSQSGDPIDDEPFDVAVGVLPHVPSIFSTTDGVVIVYSRSDEANAGAPRAYERSLARLPPSLPRHRVVTN